MDMIRQAAVSASLIAEAIKHERARKNSEGELMIKATTVDMSPEGNRHDRRKARVIAKKTKEFE